MKEISLRPYSGTLYVASSRVEYIKRHKALFKFDAATDDSHAGNWRGGYAGRTFTYLVWGRNHHYLSHELTHVALNVFDRCGIDPRDSGGEPFCYLLGQLMLDAKG